PGAGCACGRLDAAGAVVQHGLREAAARRLMKITHLTTAVVQANYDYTFVRIESDRDGLYGTGECFFAPGLTAILSELAPLLIGKDPREIQRLVQHLARKTSAAGSQAGILWDALTGGDAALHDLVGKL